MAQVTLAGARVSRGWTQKELAEKMGVSRETVIKWETGKTEMRTPYIILFCHITGFDQNDILLPTKSIGNGQEG